jgi:hypothetical protein
VSLTDIFFVGSGAVGALSTNSAELDVGSGLDPAEGIVADSATLDSTSEIQFQINGEGTTAGEDYSQLVSTGAIELGSSSLVVHVAPPSPKSSVCPSLYPGRTFTFVSTTGTLSGTFVNAPEGGPEIPIRFAERCSQISQKMRIEYSRSGDTHTVTGTVEAAAQDKQEEEATKKKHEEEIKKEEALKKPPPIFGSPVPAPITGNIEATSREAEATKKHQEEAAAATATKKRQEEETAAAAAKKQEEEKSKSKPPTRAQLLAKALKQCKKQPKKRAKCEVAARKKYGSSAKSKKGKKK